MKLNCTHKDLHLVINNNLIDDLYKFGMNHYPKEFGGLLIGYYSDDFKTCYVESTILPAKFNSSRYFFERGKEGLKQKLIEVYDASPRLIYVGEWHTHPDGIPIPSNTDLKAMTEIAESNEVNIENPILLILGIDKTEMKLGAFVYSNNKLIKYEQNSSI